VANPKTFTRSFTGGEVSPEFFGRIDDPKFQTGVETCRNFVVKPHGPAENRSGFGMVNPTKFPAKYTRLIPATFAIDETMVIEIGEGYFRAHSMGATLTPNTAGFWNPTIPYAVGDVVLGGAGVAYYCKVAHTGVFISDTTYWYAMPENIYEIPNIYAEADLRTIKYVQSNDVITLTHPNYEVHELRRYGPLKWTFTPVSFRPSTPPPSGISATATPATTTPGTPTQQSYAVTAVIGADESNPGIPSGAPAGDYTASAVIALISKANPGMVYAYGNDANPAWLQVGQKVWIDGVGGMSQINGKAYVVNTATFAYNPTNLVYDYHVTLKDAAGTVVIDTTGYSTYTAGGTIQSAVAGSCMNNLFDDGAYNTIAWTASPTAERYYVYKQTNGLYGYIGQTEATSFKDDNIAPDVAKTPPRFTDDVSSAGERPGAVGYYEQRRCFAGSINKPANFWATKSGTESNMSSSIPRRDDDAIRFRIAARERNTIRHIIPMNNLLLLTEAAEWRVNPGDGEVLTPNVSLKPQSFIGAGHATPAIVNNNLIFAAARGGHLRELAYNWEASGYLTGDLSLRATHMFDDWEIADIGYGKAPTPTIWAVSTSGHLLGCTYVPEQEVGAWHRHDTVDGWFESIACVAEGEEDILYAVVARDFGAGTHSYIERMAPRHPVNPLDLFFVDSGKSYSGAPATVFAGLGHLEGQVVAVMADGAYLGTQIVTAGAITLDEPASKVSAGLPIQADIKSLPLAFDIRGTAAYGQGVPKNVNRLWLRLYKTRNVKAGPAFDRLTEVEPRTDEPPGTPPKLLTEEVELPLEAAWDLYGQVCIRQDLPLPTTIVSITTEFAVGG